MAGTDANIVAEYVEQQTNWGVSVATDAQRDQAEARIMAQARVNGMPNNVRSLRRLLVQLFIFAANVGTGSKEYWNGKTIDYTDHNGAARTQPASEVWDRIIGDPGNVGAAAGFPATTKAYFRNRATTAIVVFKAHPDQLRRQARMNLPKEFAYLAADFLDGTKGLSSEEQAAIDAAKQLLLFRSNTSKQLNTAVQYTGAVASTSAGKVVSNARRITME
uniref:CP n=1 Tax=Anthurium alphaflexivirus 1 TaxID=2794424 RepID=A0A7T5QZ87_9VIRU|nr:CP [Anthurium alphaflexivirus 1]